MLKLSILYFEPANILQIQLLAKHKMYITNQYILEITIVCNQMISMN